MEMFFVVNHKHVLIYCGLWTEDFFLASLGRLHFLEHPLE